MRFIKAILLVAAIGLSAIQAHAQTNMKQIVGDYQGEWLDSYQGYGPRKGNSISAQVIDIGKDQYRLRLLPEFDKRCAPFVEAETSDTSTPISFENGDWNLELTSEGLTGHYLQDGKTVRFTLKKIERLSPTLGLKAPTEAEILFDGSSFEDWQQMDDRLDQVLWVTTDEGAMHKPTKKLPNLPKGAKLTLGTKKGYRDCKIHVEFRTPWQPERSGQGKGNSGLFFQGAYEIQILNSYGLPGYYNECGAFYKTAAPMVNMAAPSMQWQTYDIEFYGPRFNASGEKIKNASATVYHNGVLIHKEQDLPKRIGGKGPGEPTDPSPLIIQDHGAPVEFRNMWIIDLENS